MANIIGTFREFYKVSKEVPVRTLRSPSFLKDCPVGFFNGALQSDLCGAG